MCELAGAWRQPHSGRPLVCRRDRGCPASCWVGAASIDIDVSRVSPLANPMATGPLGPREEIDSLQLLVQCENRIVVGFGQLKVQEKKGRSYLDL